MRKAGILMPVASLPGRHGIGTFGHETYHFIDLASKAGFSIWQILPLNPLGYGNSPYQPYSSYAMDPLYLSLDLLEEQGLLKKKVPSFHRHSKCIDYEEVRQYKETFLRQAYQNFVPDQNFSIFAYQEWIRSYAIYMTFKQLNDMKCWNEWKPLYRDQPVRQNADLKPYQDEILYQVFVQYELFLQWKDLKQYANDRGIEIMGDLPFYVGIDSADVWASRQNFLLDEKGRPTFIAGVPPDYFSATGQRWGNPIYDWDYMKKDSFSFWIERLSYTERLFDQVRVDHFRAFDTYWKIKASCPTALDGEWVEAPGYELFDELFKKEPDLQIVAEDLGDLRAQVLELRDHYAFRGMRVIQFSFDPKGMKEDRTHLLVYTGTHDNAPIYGWYCDKPRTEQRAMRKYLWKHGYHKHSFVRDIIDYSLDSKADMVIIPMSDWLHLGNEARLNLPGTVGAPNWTWCMNDLSRFAEEVPCIRQALEHSHRTARKL
ncbi:MAG: 4-alpha-glucanotransferase [Solobacterium sp.]|jgi:4-alpha-glucanotransferase|nr:4-alpha-glucanotransferase [Solobacterium sp.]MCH4206295.1 4-alpha-glucanotransferase [Solobacterium sp.]MCH4227761.1 4-alpha-glucanotransferase [Solobacterium sp.]MCH4283184.1 4-alpha-glucanotransferase [Solobacterium sp.]